MGLHDDLNRLAKKPPADNRLGPAKTPLPIRAKVGIERQQVGKVSTEELTVQSTDGLFSFTVQVAR